VEDYQLLFCFYKSDKNTFTYLIENVRKSNNPEAFEKKRLAEDGYFPESKKGI